MDPQKRRRLFRDMLRIRWVEETIADKYAEQEMRCPVHLSIGQEGVAVGVCASLRQDDYLLSTHRAHAHYLAKGGSLKSLVAEIYGKETGCAHGKGGSMHLVDLGVNIMGSTPIVGNSLPVAVGVAFGTWMQEQDRVTVVFFGDGSTEEGVFMEALNFAALKKLPVVFVCENNLYSVYSPLSVRQPINRSRVGIAEAHGISAHLGNGNDVECVARISEEAIVRVRRGEGPCYLEFDTYRWREHCGPNYDNHIGYRTEEEFSSWKKRCPIVLQRSRLLQDHVVHEDEIAAIEEDIQKEILEAFDFAKKSPFPERQELLKGIYAP